MLLPLYHSDDTEQIAIGKFSSHSSPWFLLGAQKTSVACYSGCSSVDTGLFGLCVDKQKCSEKEFTSFVLKDVSF